MSKFLYALSLSTLFLLVYSIMSTSVYLIEPTDLGLISRLPLTFWFGLVTLGLLWYFCQHSQKCQVIAFILTIAFLYVAPAVIRTPVWLSASYYPFGESVLINQVGHLVDYPAEQLVSYHSWPLFLYLASAFTLVTSLPHYILLKFFPLLTIGLFGLVAFLILRSRLKNYAILGATWILSSFFLRQYYFGPAGISYIFFLFLLLIVTWLFFEEKANSRVLKGLFLFLLAVVTLTHALTSLMSLITVIALYITQRLTHRKPHNVTAGLCLFSAVIVLSYNVFFAPGFFKVVTLTSSSILSGTEFLGIYKEPFRVVGSMAERLGYFSYWAIVLLNGIVAVIAILQMVKVRTRDKKNEEGFQIFWVILLLILGAFAFTGEYGPHEAAQRAFMFGLISLTYLCINLLKRKPKILIPLLVVLVFLNIPAQYAGDSYTLATYTQLTGAKFFVNHSSQYITCFAEFSLYFRYYDPQKNVTFLTLGTLPFTAFPNSSTVTKVMNKAGYIIVSDLTNNYYVYFLGRNPLNQVEFGPFNKLYDSHSFAIFGNETLMPQ